MIDQLLLAAIVLAFLAVVAAAGIGLLLWVAVERLASYRRRDYRLSEGAVRALLSKD
ncbi:MAG: hypothetical protein M1482_10930 [Chloroflexi bacterium]|nr:hypothetical protein [Chloroflexota bacterium]